MLYCDDTSHFAQSLGEALLLKLESNHPSFIQLEGKRLARRGSGRVLWREDGPRHALELFLRVFLLLLRLLVIGLPFIYLLLQLLLDSIRLNRLLLELSLE